MILFVLYLAVCLIGALPGFSRRVSVDGFVTANRGFGVWLVAGSLVTTIIGASTTLGMAGLVRQFGAAGFWWLGLGAIGLLLMAAFVAKPLYELKALSIADAAGKLVGKPVARLTALIIVVAWTGIIAAQFVAVGTVMAAITHSAPEPYVILAGLTVTLYTVLGGQKSVIQSDFVQTGVLVAGFLVVFFVLLGKGEMEAPRFEALISNRFGIEQLFLLAIPLFGAYMAGPDMFSRINTARSIGVVRRSLVLAALVMLVFGALITAIALHASTLPGDGNPLLGALLGSLPTALAWLFCLGLVAAMIAGADICLLTAGTLLGCDLVGIARVGILRVMIVVIGLGATVVALFVRDIIGLLLSAYSVYTAGIAGPLVVAILARGRRRRPRVRRFLAAMLTGGACGVVAAVGGLPWLTIIGVGLSVGLALRALEPMKEA